MPVAHFLAISIMDPFEKENLSSRTFFMSTYSNKSTKHSDREKLRSKSFWIAFEMVFIFGIPAALVVLLSQWLISNELTGDWVLYVGLFSAFTVSWLMVLLRVKRLSAEFKQVDEEDHENTKS